MYKFLRNPISYLVLLATLIGVADIQANPKTRSYRVPPDVLLKAAKKAAAGHTIIRLSDADSQVFSDGAQDTLSLAFVTKIEGFAPSVVAVINITQRKDGVVDLEVFYRRKETGTVRIPSTEFLARKTAYETELVKTLDLIDAKRHLLEIRWSSGQVDRTEYYSTRRSLDAEEYNARVNTINLIYKARIEDFAQMPRTTFAAMDEAAEKYFELVQKNLGTGETGASSERRAQSLRNCDEFEQQVKAGKVFISADDQANYLRKCSDVRSGKLND